MFTGSLDPGSADHAPTAEHTLLRPGCSCPVPRPDGTSHQLVTLGQHLWGPGLLPPPATLPQVPCPCWNSNGAAGLRLPRGRRTRGATHDPRRHSLPPASPPKLVCPLLLTQVFPSADGLSPAQTGCSTLGLHWFSPGITPFPGWAVGPVPCGLPAVDEGVGITLPSSGLRCHRRLPLQTPQEHPQSLRAPCHIWGQPTNKLSRYQWGRVQPPSSPYSDSKCLI